MSNFKFSPDLFLEVAELERFKKFLDEDGFRKNLLDNTTLFGLIKTNKDLNFLNGKVERDLDTSVGQKTIKIRALEAINKRGLFIRSQEINTIPVPADGRWYWVKAQHEYSNLEEGIVSLSIDGALVGVGTKFTEVLRGAPNFPARIKFSNSQYNTLEYDVLEVIDDEHAIVMHPAVNGTGIATFEVEDFLRYKVVGTFTQGVAIDNQSKYPFEYDSLKYELIAEIVENQRPDYIKDEDFYLARIKVQNGDVVIQDKRIEYWETKGSQAIIDIDLEANPLIGVEYIKWQNLLSPANENEVHIAWGMRSQNWSVDSSKNIVTIFGSATGGRYKDLSHFSDGDFDGWRLYNAKGTYSIISSSIKQGQAINLTLDVLDVDNFSDDGGVTFRDNGPNADWLLVTPNAESIEIICAAGIDDLANNIDRNFTFPINTLIGRCDLEVFTPECLYNIKYRYIVNNTYSVTRTLPSDEIGYYAEISYDSNGNFKPEVDRIRIPYETSETAGYITLKLSPNSYSTMIDLIYKGDKIGVQTVTTFNTIQVYELQVGRDKRYQHITGNIDLADDVYISLSDNKAVEGNEFRIHIDCESLSMNGRKIYIIREYTSGTPVILKTISQGDIYQMQNQEGGIVFTCVFSDLLKWSVVSQNYDLGTPNEIKVIDGQLSNLFDGNGLGKVRGLFGYAVCDGNNNTPDLRNRFLLGQSTAKAAQSIGGSFEARLSAANQLPLHDHQIGGNAADRNTSGGGYPVNQVHLGGYDANGSGQTKTSKAGQENPEPFNVTNPYYAMIFAKKIF